MDLRDKLRQMGAVEPVKHHMQASESDLERIIPGEVKENDAGQYYRVSRSWQLDESHGCIKLDSFVSAKSNAFALAAKDATLGSMDLRKALFIDTETTGLAGGAGTVPFLVGLGWIEGDVFRVEQYFMRDYHEERAVLLAIRERALQCNWLVSYNGKSYDLNLLATRYIMHREETPFNAMPHWDLLHSSRRFWRLRLRDCSLGSVEEHILAFKRTDDVPGYMIPQIYFDYLRDKKTLRLEPVFSHNQLDIVSLLALAGVLGKLVSKPEEAISYGEDWLALARLYEDRSEWERAAEAYAFGVDMGLSDHLEREARWHSSLALKRAGKWEEALELWRLLSRNGAMGVAPYEEAAKYFEHRVNNYEKARITVVSALKRLDLRRELGRAIKDVDARERLNYRLARLERKLTGKKGCYVESSE